MKHVLALSGVAALLAWGCGGKTTGDGGAGGGGNAGNATVGSGPSAGSQGVAVGAGGFGPEGVGVGVGGGPGAGGSGGMAGVGVLYCDPAHPYPAPLLPISPIISDFESGLVVQATQPAGVWVLDTDGMGTGSMNVEPCGLRGMGMHFVGKGHTVWGSEVSVALVSTTQPVDVSAYRGVSFLIRSATSNQIIFKVQNPYSQPACGKCDDTVVGEECYSGYIKFLSLPAGVIVPEVVAWSDLGQQTWGYKAPGTVQFDARNFVSLELAFDKSIDFDVCIDDVMLVP